jgi:hypothetical protein
LTNLILGLEDQPSTLALFTVNDPETANGNVDVLVTATSANTTLLPNDNIFIGVSGGNRTLTLLPGADQTGESVVTVTARDKDGNTDVETLVFRVTDANDPPTITAIADVTVAEDGATAAIPFQINDTETPVAQLTVATATSNPNVVATSGIVLGGGGQNRTITVTPVANGTGTATITVTVTDAGDPAAQATETFVVTVTAVNDKPTISSITDQVTDEGQTITVNFTVSDVETDAAALSMSGTSSNQNLVENAKIVFGGSGQLRNVSLEPRPGKSGATTITLTVSDGTESSTATFKLTVIGVNRDDMNGDGKTDLVYQQRDGFLLALFMDGNDQISYEFLQPNYPGDPNWILAASSDLDGDADMDLIFQHTDGTLAVWYMNGTTQASSAVISSTVSSPAWRLVATGDFNNDGIKDFLFQNQALDGQLAIWYMNGINKTGDAVIANSPGSAWVAVGVADFAGANGVITPPDGNVDILFQNNANSTLAA